MHRRLTLISAPAGFGKTTLASQWVACCKRPTAWLSLDEGDNDPTRFLNYFIAALQTIAENIGKGVLGVLQTPQSPPTESIIAALLNELNTVSENVTIVLDDYHVIDAQSIDNALTFLLDHLPPQVHLIIATREDPHLPLPRLRARGQLNELRAADLRFTTSEAADYINQIMGMNLSAQDINALETATEGWIAGLQLAAMSMKGHTDITGFIKSFTGRHRFVMDYLVEEVLQHQSESLKTFLLYTSILDSMCGSLCDAVLCDPSVSGQETLEYIEHANLFIVPLDNERRWYRYHPLFADLLQQRLHKKTTSNPGGNEVKLAELHLRASIWYDDNALAIKALHHAFAAKDFERAANLVELTWAEMDQSYRTDTWLGWLKALPGDIIRSRPVLCVGYAWALLDKGEVEAVESLLRDAERCLDDSPEMSERSKAPSAKMVIVDDKQFHSLPATIADARATRSLMLGDIPDTITHAQRALDLVPEQDPFRRGAITGTLGIAYWTSGDLETAHRYLTDCTANMQMAGKIHLALGVTFVLAEIRRVQGRLREAIRTYEPSLHRGTVSDEPVPLATADLYLGLSVLNREQGDMDAATQHLLRSKELGGQSAFPAWQYRWCLAQARMKETEGDLEAALNLLHDAEHLDFDPFLPDVCPLAALKTRVWVRLGNLIESFDWAREKGVSTDDDLSYLREFEHITLARVLIAEYQSSHADHFVGEAIGLLKRLQKAAEKGGRIGSVIEIFVLLALAYEARDDMPSGLLPLERALSLAEPEGYVRIFVDEGIPMARLLSQASAHGIMPDYAKKLLTVFENQQGKSDKSCIAPAPPAQSLIEPLSKRELEVLQLIAQGLTNREIGERLFLALDTVKGHNRNIFGKLGVRRRTQAVARARELSLF